MGRWLLGGFLSRLLGRPRRGPAIDPREARAILASYVACLERRAPGALGREQDLPYSKELIGRVILRALEVATDGRIVTGLRQGFVDLETFVSAEEYTDATASLRAEIDARKDRRRQLLLIIEEERAARPR